MTKLENGKRVNEGVCITCAKELGLPLDNLLGDYMSKMGVTPEQIAQMEDEMAEMLGGDENGIDSGAPAIDLKSLFKQAGLTSDEGDAKAGKTPVVASESSTGAGVGGAKKEKTLKFLDSFCTNLTRRAKNGELDAIEPAIDSAVEMLAPGGRVCIITFHSLEDRIVKQTYAKHAEGCTCPKSFPICVCGKTPKVKVVTRKPIVPSELELEENPRSRSSKLRIAEKL